MWRDVSCKINPLSWGVVYSGEGEEQVDGVINWWMGLIWVHLSLWPVVVRVVLICLEFLVNEINYISIYGVPVDQETVVPGRVLSF